ncbi:hypothetical protein P43SY_007142 [Pythium insidiosum]|uniref:Bzip transcription factor n=1 Tax=Pythium insidiosum TaxID=114742 RepID=A0AAD5LB96_PYTIN|nr:hypothetical protein P43SY_007142 [Pythium insidiosum]
MASSNSDGPPRTPRRATAMPLVITTLADAQPYEADVSRGVCRTADDELLPLTSKKKHFPRGLRRFRDRLQSLEERLRLDVNSLKQEIIDLNLQRSLFETRMQARRVSLSEKAMKTVMEYVAAFERGLQIDLEAESFECSALSTADEAAIRRATDRWLSSMTSAHASHHNYRDLHGRQRRRHDDLQLLRRARRRSGAASAAMEELERQAAARQLAFVNAALDPAMILSQQSAGIRVFLQQWDLYTKCHIGLRFTMETLHSNGSTTAPVVTCTGRIGGYITRETLENVFPRVLQHPELMQRLIGVRVDYPYHMDVEFNSDGRMVRYDVELDFVAALTSVLGSLRDVSFVMEDARIYACCLIGHPAYE